MAPRRLAFWACLLIMAAPILIPHAQGDQVGDVQCLAPATCPNLMVDPSTTMPKTSVETFSISSCAVVEGATQAGARTLLRFTFTTPNVGPGDVMIGDPALRPDLFEYSTCHGHYHFKKYAAYRLWTPTAFAEWDKLRKVYVDELPDRILQEHPDLTNGLVTGAKRGFCMIDVKEYSGNALPGKYSDCNHLQGITAGWADEYGAQIEGQWIDVTGLPPGPYVLETEVNAERLLTETNYADNRAWVDVDLT